MYGFKEYDRDWANNFVDTIAAKRPDYYSQKTLDLSQEPDFDSNLGYVLGILARYDVIHKMFQGGDIDSGVIVASDAAMAFGEREDYDGLAMLLGIERFSDMQKYALKEVFKAHIDLPHRTKGLY